MFNRYAMGVLCDPVSAISGAVGLVGNVVGGIVGNSAAKKAAAVQQQAAQTAAKGVTDAAASVNPGITSAAQTAGANALTAAGGVTNAANVGAQGAISSANEANGILDQYSQAGQAASKTIQQGEQAGGQFNSTPTLAQLQIDPGQKYVDQQGAIAEDRSAAARGGAISGAALKSLTNYEYGVNSQEYQNAFNNFQTNTNNNFSRLNATSGQGIQTGTTQGGNLINASQYAGNLTTGAANTNLNANEYAGSANLNAAETTGANTINAASKAGDYATQGANAEASGIVGGTNALVGGITGGINSATSAVRTSQLLANPALSGGAVTATGQYMPPINFLTGGA